MFSIFCIRLFMLTTLNWIFVATLPTSDDKIAFNNMTTEQPQLRLIIAIPNAGLNSNVNVERIASTRGLLQILGNTFLSLAGLLFGFGATAGLTGATSIGTTAGNGVAISGLTGSSSGTGLNDGLSPGLNVISPSNTGMGLNTGLAGVGGSGGSLAGSSGGTNSPVPVSFGNGITATINISGIPTGSTASTRPLFGQNVLDLVSTSTSAKSDEKISQYDYKNSQSNDVHPYGKVTYFMPKTKPDNHPNQQPAIVHKIQANKISNGTETVSYEGFQYLK